MNRPRTDKDFADWNEAMARKYNPADYYEHASALVRFVERRRLREVLSLADPHPYDDVLEVGCGPGVVLEALHRYRTAGGSLQRGAAGGPDKAHGRLAGVDLSDSMLAAARKRLAPVAAAGVRVELEKAPAEKLPFDDDSFDVVVCTEVLEHVMEPARVAQELARVARPAGRVVVSVPNEPLIDRLKRLFGALGLFGRLLPGIPEEMDEEWHLHSFDHGMLEAEAKPYVRLSEVRRAPWSWLPLHFVAVGRKRPPDRGRCE